MQRKLQIEITYPGKNIWPNKFKTEKIILYSIKIILLDLRPSIKKLTECLKAKK
jgi:hypothetical protein